MPRQIAAAGRLGASTSPSAGGKLKAILDGLSPEDKPELREALEQASTAYEERAAFYRVLETVFFGLSLGSVLALSAVGLAITFGVMGVINMAHGELMMLGAYTAYV